jgi:hypothetical protein
LMLFILFVEKQVVDGQNGCSSDDYECLGVSDYFDCCVHKRRFSWFDLVI